MQEQRVGEVLKKLQKENIQKSNNFQKLSKNQIPKNSQNTNNIQYQKSWIFYLELDINQTEKRFKKYTRDYNQELHKPNFLKEQYQIHQNHKVSVQPSQKSLAIKSTQIMTAVSIIKSLFQHLKLVEKGKMLKNTNFTTNNKAIATMTGMCDRSSRRHVNKLLATGFLQEKIFRGTNASYILKINPEFLVARPHPQLTDLLIKQHIEKHPGIPIHPITYKHYNSLRPSFSDFPSGIIKTVCPLTVINPDTFNNNILSKGIVDNCRDTKSPPSQKLTVINNDLNNSSCVGKPDNKNPEQTNVRPQLGQSQAYQEKLQREIQSNIPPEILKTIFFYTEIAWNFTRSVLYQNRTFRTDQEQITQKFIAEFFMEYAKNYNPRTMSRRYEEFTITIQMINNFTNRRIDWQIARPEYFFDPHFKGGFYGAIKEWLPKQLSKQEQNKDWNTNKLKVAKAFKYYSTDPTYERYQLCVQKLGKLKNKKFLDTFNACVLDNKNFNTQFLNQQN